MPNSHIIDAQVDNEDFMPLVGIEACKYKDVIGSSFGLEIPLNPKIIGCNSNGSSKRSQRKQKPTLQSIVTKRDKYAYSKRESKSSVDNNLDGKYKAIMKDTKNGAQRYHLHSLKCKNTISDLAKLS